VPTIDSAGVPGKHFGVCGCHGLPSFLSPGYVGAAVAQFALSREEMTERRWLSDRKIAAV